jgi:mRNA interferase MazF
MAVRRGNVVIVSHGEFGRPRPAIVVQSDELGDSTATVLVCPITSELTERLPVRPIIQPAQENGLRVRSQIMTDKLLAAPRERVRSVIGAIDSETSNRLDTALLIVLGLAR